ncbi:MAG: leucyl/phenylalanyl-tRNA--protein transferase, partial [Geminicoccaceae bacterium]
MRRGGFEIRVDSAFEAVIGACAEPTPERPRTWLNEQL